MGRALPGRQARPALFEGVERVKAMDWLRLHVSTLDSAKVQALPGALFKAWVNCLCLARINDGRLPPIDVIAFRLRCSERQAEQWRDDLTARKLVDITPDGAHRMHDWDQHQYVSDGSTERVRKHREKRRQAVSETFHETPVEPAGNVTVTPPDTEQIQSRTETDSEAARASAQRAEVRPIRSPERWMTDEVFVRFRARYLETGAALIDEDFSEAYEFCW